MSNKTKVPQDRFQSRPDEIIQTQPQPKKKNNGAAGPTKKGDDNVVAKKTQAESPSRKVEVSKTSVSTPTVLKTRSQKAPVNLAFPQLKQPVTRPNRPGIKVESKQIPLKTRQQIQSESNFNVNRVASQASVGVADKIQNRLRKKSPWYDSIMNPTTGGGVKIPDPIGTDTGTYQHIQNVSVPVDHAGVCGLRVISPYINTFKNIDDKGSNYQTTEPGASDGLIHWSDGVTDGQTIPFNIIPDLMRANARVHRVVSACVIAQPEISTLNDSGEMCSFVTPESAISNGGTAIIAYPSYQAQWDSSMVPVNAHKPMIARWYPLEGEYRYFTGAAFTSADPMYLSYRDFVDPNDGREKGIIPWEFGVVCKGLTPATGVVRFQIVVNYEFIPLLSSAMVALDASPIDPMEEQLVNHWVSQDPMTQVISQKEASQAATPTKVAEEPSGFGMLYNVVEEMMPMLIKNAPKLLALL